MGTTMNDAQSTIAGLKYQRCPGGGWNGMPAELEGEATVADCLAHGDCGCIYGDAVQHIERLTEALTTIRDWYIDHQDDAEMMAKFAGKALALEQNEER
jgi:hypothetical protein